MILNNEVLDRLTHSFRGVIIDLFKHYEETSDHHERIKNFRAALVEGRDDERNNQKIQIVVEINLEESEFHPKETGIVTYKENPELN